MNQKFVKHILELKGSDLLLNLTCNFDIGRAKIDCTLCKFWSVIFKGVTTRCHGDDFQKKMIIFELYYL